MGLGTLATALKAFLDDTGVTTDDATTPRNLLYANTVAELTADYASDATTWERDAGTIEGIIGAFLAPPAAPPAAQRFNVQGTAGGGFDYEGIARAVGFTNVTTFRQYWPMIAQALASQGIASRNVIIASLATIRVETQGFVPIGEGGSGARYKGRGFIQLTGAGNYATYGTLIGVDLVHRPELANDPGNAARIFALFMKRSGAAAAANAGNFLGVRQIVNGGHLGAGGLHGVPAYLAAVAALQANPRLLGGQA